MFKDSRWALAFFSNINRDRYAAAEETHQKKLNSLFFSRFLLSK